MHYAATTQFQFRVNEFYSHFSFVHQEIMNSGELRMGNPPNQDTLKNPHSTNTIAVRLKVSYLETSAEPLNPNMTCTVLR